MCSEQCTICRYQQQLDQQLEMLQSEREKVFEQFLQEKEMIDQAVRKIQAENEEAALKKMMAKKATQQQVMERSESDLLSG